MTFHKRIIKYILVVFILISLNAFSQEHLRPLSGNINLYNGPKSQSTNKKINTTSSPLNLPFFDDFSYAYKSPYPSVNNWLDSNTYINTGFAINPITLGVATFDGLNKRGYPYLINAPVSYSGPADTLTSRPINLQYVVVTTSISTTSHVYSPADSIFLTFYYQAEGYGDAPESNDSLCVDFFKPNQNRWKKVWGVKGYNPSASDTSFYRVRIPIADTSYCDSLFQFRFRNKATTSGSLDHWHIDYVQIKYNYLAADTTNDDVAFGYKPSSFLKNYSIMPYRQYDTLELATTFRNYIRNNFASTQFSTYDFTVSNALSTAVPTPTSGTFITGVSPFLPTGGYYTGNAAHPVFGSKKPFPLPFVTQDSTFFTIQHVVTTSSDIHRSNDTVVHVQKFSNYYAYDDGSAEVGYYLNTYGAKTAVRFTLNVEDTLKAVRIYFDPIVEGTLISNSQFRLMIWNSNSGTPGSIVYKDSILHPSYISGNYNLIPTYHLTSCLPLAVGSYFIGIQQITNQPLNIGFDKNTNHMDALYYDIGNGWVQSAVRGSIMINPVMGCIDPPAAVGLMEHEIFNNFNLFPNPAQNTLTVNYPKNELENAQIDILSSIGQSVLTKSITSNEPIDISNLTNGLYFVYVKGNNQNVSPKKLIISK